MNNKLYYDSLFALYLKRIPNDYIYQRYFSYYNTDESHDEDGFQVMQDYVNMNIKKEFEWATGISIIEAIESIINDSASNGNINIHNT